MEATCAACGKPFAAKTARKQFCDRKACQRARARKRQRSARSPNVVDLSSRRGSDEPVAVNATRSTRETLARAGVLDTPLGQGALALAQRLDNPGDDSGSSLAAVQRAHAKAMADALKDAEDAEDNVTNLRSFRSRRRAQA